MNIHGRKLTPRELRKRVGNMDQVAGIKLVQFDDGNERPARAALFHTGTGLTFTVLLDRGMDIGAASYCGKAMAWRATPGDVAPQYFEPEWTRWLRSFHGGLVATCGLMTVGAPVEESAIDGAGLHGRIGNTPARNLQVRQEWEGGDYVMSVTGTMREVRVFGENLALTRTVTARMGDNAIRLHDSLTNEGFNKTEFQLLYHCNIGWPAVDEGAEFLAPSRHVAPRDEDAAKGSEDWAKCGKPVHDYAEKCYFHDMAPDRQKWVTCAVVNDGFEKGGDGFGVYLKYSRANLPRFTQWKQMGEQEYVVGMEPCNCGIQGRWLDEEQGLLHSLRPGETKEYDLELGPVCDAGHYREIRAACKKVRTKIVGHYTEFVEKP